MQVKDIVNYLEQRFPLENAEDFDIPRIGLIVGSLNIEVENILLSLDLTLDVANEAVKKSANLIIVHHPFFFDGFHKVLFDDMYGQVLEILFKNKISVFAMHTNFDVGVGGINDCLAKKLGLNNFKIANDSATKSNFLRYGEIDAISLLDLAYVVKSKLEVPGVRILGNEDRQIKCVGIIGGSGAHKEDIDNAKKFGCDCLITGEVKLNNAQYAEFIDLCILEVNHGIEKHAFYFLKEELEKYFSLNNKVFVSTINTDPMKKIIV